MNVLWFTSRNMVDLCSTTQVALGEGLMALGHQVTIVNSDEEGSHIDFSWSHISIPAQAIRGRKAHVLGKGMHHWFSNFQTRNQTVAIVDWSIASSLSHLLKKKAIPWILMDRSPPADRGVLAKFQWLVWKKAWKLVKNRNALLGCVVSSSHGEFVHLKTGVLETRMIQIPAGVDTSLFKPGPKSDILTLVYHGRLDRNRGVLSLPILLEKLRQNDVQAKLLLIGEGDSYERLQRMAQSRDDIEVLSTLPQKQLSKQLSRCHIGLLPMPKSKVWTLASPLKRSEYAASGLLMFGIDHSGHRIDSNLQPPWIHLVAQEDFHFAGVKWIQSLTTENIQSFSVESREYAEQHFKWNQCVERLEQACLSCLN